MSNQRRRGPKPATMKTRRTRAMADPMRYIGFNRKIPLRPWFVRLDGRITGRYATEEEARDARDKALKIQP